MTSPSPYDGSTEIPASETPAKVSEPEGGLAAYAQRCREEHQRLANGWCSCDKPLCPERFLLDHIDNLLRAYQLKVQDFAAETARNSECAVAPERSSVAAELAALREEYAALIAKPQINTSVWAWANAEVFRRTTEHLTFSDRDAALIEWMLVRIAHEEASAQAVLRISAKWLARTCSREGEPA